MGPCRRMWWPGCSDRTTIARMRRVLAGVFASLALAACLAPAAMAGARKSSYRVLVTQPDESGLPVSLDTDVYLPDSPPPASGYPFVLFFHGGGSSKDDPFDSGHARFFAEHGYATILYSARGHGTSDGQTSVAGPKEMRDTFDVLAWAFKAGGPGMPSHPDFRIDRDRMALSGYSQGGLNTNLAQAWSGDSSLDPYGFRFRALEPGNTPDVTFNALVPNNVVKLSFGVGLLGTYAQGAHGHVAPIVDKWIATAAADRPELYGAGDVCSLSGHDRTGSTMKQDLAARSAGCLVDRMTPPSFWAQSFDDGLFPPDMGISMFNRMPAGQANRLYLSMGGHAAPSAPAAVEKAKLDLQLAFMNHVLLGTPLGGPRVVYWTRDPTVATGPSKYPAGAWIEQSSASWPPPGTRDETYRLGADGRAVQGRASDGTLPLAPFSQDQANDPVARAVLSNAPVGSSPTPADPGASGAPGQVASFATAPFGSEFELAGAPSAKLLWTPGSPDTQLVLKVLDAGPDGRLTLLSRGVQGIRGANAGAARTVSVTGNAFDAVVRRGHRIIAWVSAGDASFYKSYPGSAGGSLEAGNRSTLALPLRGFSPSGTRSACLPARLRVRRGRIGRIRVGRTMGDVLARAGTASARGRRTLRYCVRGGGRVTAAFSRSGLAALVLTTARGHRAPRLRNGERLRTARRRWRVRRVGKGLYIARRGKTRLLLGSRRRRVRFVAVADRRVLRRRAVLRRYLRLAGVRR
jgi:X-Pro dipeptidyl-peptidase-like protein